MGKLAVLILTRNEEQNIEDCIRSAAFADEVVVIDSGSTDRTVELAKKCGAKVVFHAWPGDFSAQRNFALTQTDADWVFYLDADERITGKIATSIQRIVDSGRLDRQYAVERRSVAFGTRFRHGVLKPDQVFRLFPRNQVEWTGEVHERPICELPKKVLDGYIEHYTYRSWQQWEKKLCQYTTIWAEEAYQRGKRITLADILLHSIGGFLKMFILRLGFLDGWMGIYMCCNHFFYTMLKYLKLYERINIKNGVKLK